MGPRELLRWQWEGYPRYHTTRGNLLLHLCTVPLFWAGTVLLVTAALMPSGPPAAFGAGCLLAALIAQGRGHKLEPTPPAPFTGPWNFVARFCLEQWVNFPRFLLTGGWWRNLRASRQMPTRKKPARPGFQRGEAALRKHALGFPEAREDFPWGERVIKVNKKIFVFLHGDAKTLRVTTKLPASYGAALLAPFARPTGYGLGKSGWVSCEFKAGDQVPYDILKSWIEESYRAVAPKRLTRGVSPGKARGPSGR